MGSSIPNFVFIKIFFSGIIAFSLRFDGINATEFNSLPRSSAYTAHWGTINDQNAKYILESSPNYTISKLDEWKNTSMTYLISLDWSETNDIVRLVLFCLNQVAFHNRQYEVPWEVWLSLNLRGDMSEDLDSTINVTTMVNEISNGTITTFILDYNLLQLSPTSLPLVQQDVQICNRKVGSANLRCGVIIDSMNCLTSLGHVTRLGLEPGNIFIVRDDFSSYRRTYRRFHSVVPCMYVLQNSGALLGFTLGITDLDDFEGYQVNSAISKISSQQYSNFSYTGDDLHIDYVIADKLFQRRRYNPIKNLYEWLSRPVEFSKKQFGVSVYSRDIFLVEHSSILISLLRQFRTVYFEVGNTNEFQVAEFIKAVIHATSAMFPNAKSISNEGNYDDDVLPQLGMVKNINSEDLEMNKRLVNSLASIANAENKVFPNIVSLILFNWAVPPKKNGSQDMTTRRNMFLSQAEALQPVLDYVGGLNHSEIELGVIWKIEELNEIFSSKESVESIEQFTRFMNFHTLAIDVIVLKITLQLKKLSLEHLLFTSRTLIFMLGFHIDQIRGPPNKTANPQKVSVYIGFYGCNGVHQHTNVTEITDFIIFWEIINNWAVNKNVKVIMDTAYEMDQREESGAQTEPDCWQGHALLGNTSCMCGWWNVYKKCQLGGNVDCANRTTIEDKKSIARRLFEESHLQNIKDAEDEVKPLEHPDSLPRVMKLLIVGTILFTGLLGIFSIYVFCHYRSKSVHSQMQVQSFLFGSKRSSVTTGTEHEGNVNAHISQYDKNRYEVTPSSFSIDFSSPLGIGEYATVCRGVIKGAEADIEVAVKSLRFPQGNWKDGNMLAFKGLLSEIKILSYVGNHPNVVKLKGAYTAKLRRGTILVFLEMCSMGSLDKHIRAYRSENVDTSQITASTVETSFSSGNTNSVDEHDESNNQIEEGRLPDELNSDIVKWSQEIACGMEFLTAKKLVHADLATRNILLDATKTAKISDFGLSRRLYNYSEYVKKEEASLPWRWMAPESLRKLIFTEKSDVWSFGVTLWEMYTLGDLPYHRLSYSTNFPVLLLSGEVRLPKPMYSTSLMYSIMKQCWESMPEKRPRFADLQVMLTG